MTDLDSQLARATADGKPSEVLFDLLEAGADVNATDVSEKCLVHRGRGGYHSTIISYPT